MQNVLFLMSIPQPRRAAAFAKKRPMRANVAVAGFGLQRTALLTGQANAPSEAALAAFECFAPPRPPLGGGGGERNVKNDARVPSKGALA